MTIALAIEADREEHVEKAATLYEASLASVFGPVEAVLNLAVLYWQATDTGFHARHHLPDDFVDRAFGRLWPLLDQAAANFPEHPGPQFWKKYIKLISLGEEFPLALCRHM